ncbi:hypothetical protein [Pseudobacteriovorax antillogorgiicola]|uniref:Uncharacterized protein n=1 Tax=Pseudobacteriovorax antillogorgiicola TaxID=1513793 RepID=A0A1Y6BIV3_9BACT|nr:hypothetical protein [Pseudobacteriovorax antillogorgiicola]TCS55419.1 hypothetical protein EDD56_105140 [Pseudobacteriovorax antillogorgiicola]SMF12609.1 hypothetical protein SAMN06296036_105184 [Pseudobacteriovorax antillogorgiicola]
MKTLLGTLMLCFICWGCQQEEIDSTGTTAPTSTPVKTQNNDEQSSANEDPEPFTGDTCEDLEIPSWDRQINRLTENRCVRCHNDSFAWNGVQLQTYELFMENAEISKERLEKGELSFDIFIYEIQMYLDWFDAGMPKTERDCATS